MKKIMISIYLVLLYILLSSSVSLAAYQLPSFEKLCSDLGSDVIDVLSGAPNNQWSPGNYLISGTTYANQGANAKYEVNKDSLMKTPGSRVYCISAGQGCGAQSGDTFEFSGCYIIGPKGLYYSANGMLGSEYDPQKLIFVRYDELKEEGIGNSVRSLHHILSASDEYGTMSGGKYMVTAGNFIDNHSKRQYAIWKTINPFLEYLKEIDQWSSNLGIYNDYVHATYGDTEVNELYSESINNVSIPGDYVVMWLFKATGTNVEGGFYQDIMVAGKITSEPPPNPENYPSNIYIKKIDIDNNNPIEGARFALCKKEEGKYTCIDEETTNSKGYITFTGLDFSKNEYKIYEYAPAYGYDLAKVSVDGKAITQNDCFYDYYGVKFDNIPSFKLEEVDKSQTITVKNKKKTEEKHNITIKKIDNYGNPLSGVYFAICTVGKLLVNGTEKDAYLFQWKLRTDGNGKIEIKNVPTGTRYAVFEYETLRGYSMEPKDIMIAGPNNDNYKSIPSSENEYRFYDGNKNSFTKPLCFDVTIQENSAENLVYTIKNTKKLGGFQIRKVDTNTQKRLQVFTCITNTNISGLTIDNYKEKCIQWHSTINGYATYSNLPIGETYTVWEYNNKEGYKKGFLKVGNVKITDSNSRIDGTDGDETITLSWNVPHNTIANPGYGGLNIQKVGKNGNNLSLSGVVFKLYQYNKKDKKLESKYSLTTDSNGFATSSTVNKKYSIVPRKILYI